MNIALVATLIAVAMYLILFISAQFSPTVHSGGCNHIPLVDGHPAYQCTAVP